jgi:hypothetical protein
MQKKKSKYSLLMVFLMLTTLFISFETSSIAANQIILSWDPITEPDLEGYVLSGKQGSPDPPFESQGRDY